MSRTKQCLLATVFVIAGIGGALVLKYYFENEMATGGFSILILVWAIAVLGLCGWAINALTARSLQCDLATAKRREQEWQNERALRALLDEKIFAIFTICYTPTPESVPDARYYPDFRKQLLLANKGPNNLWDLLRFKQVPAIPTLRGVDRLTNEQLEKLYALVQRTQPTSVR